MIHKLQNKDIDKVRWDSLVQNSQCADVYALSAYLDVVCPHWYGVILGDYEAIMPLPVKKRFFFSYIVQPIFSQQYRIYSQRDISIEEVDLFRKEILKYKFVRICLSLSLFDTAVPRYNFSLDLSKSYVDIAQNYSKNTRRNIQKAQKSGLICTKTDNVERAMQDFFTADTKNYYSPYENTIRSLVACCDSETYEVKNGSEILAVAVFFKTQKRLYYLFPASTSKGKQLSAMFLLLDSVIRTYAETSFTLDFEGSKITGVRRFYEGFGARHETYYYFKKIITHLYSVF
ncbi:MAG: GNAT family N-acetyltransferase [Bacteroidales bacterium]|nr:GNAT family N-acetyltransferase [Bacteroidales bacterium]